MRRVAAAPGTGRPGIRVVGQGRTVIGADTKNLAVENRQRARVFLIEVRAAPQLVDGYEVIDLGTLGGNNAIPMAMNDAAQVVGCSRSAPGPQADTCRPMSAETMKIPDPIMEPTTSEIAASGPMPRMNSGD